MPKARFLLNITIFYQSYFKAKISSAFLWENILFYTKYIKKWKNNSEEESKEQKPREEESEKQKTTEEESEEQKPREEESEERKPTGE